MPQPLQSDAKLGLTFRFEVEVDGINLGGWESCKGLQVDFNLKEIREGGTNDHSYWLPDKIKYQKITLTRAMRKTDSGSVQGWLARYARKGVRGTASITLRDACHDEVQTWRLYNVAPQSWQGPSLTAQDSKVAIETLVLVHEGFVDKADKGFFGDGQRVKAKLENTEDGQSVVFTFSPETITLNRGVNNKNAPSMRAKGYTDSNWAGATPRSLKGTAILTGEGEFVRTKAELLLLSWMDPGAGGAGGPAPSKGKAGGGGSKQNKPAKPKKLTFTWGSWPPIPCTLKQVSVEYQRFDSSGNPTRAQIQFTVNEEPDPTGDKSTNPTSGGLPGRQAHVLTDGENLHLIAAHNYGHPGAWRAVADVNGIDDPFRVQPGNTVYLPNANELIGG
jgi:phage tail-like protein